MQKLQLVNVEFFKVILMPLTYYFFCAFGYTAHVFSFESLPLQGICELFELFFHFTYETFCQLDAFSNGKGLLDLPSSKVLG